jgi:hypothetical protein
MTMMKRNDEERRLWVLNDEPLYRWWKSEGGATRTFVRNHRAEIDVVIDARHKGQTWGLPCFGPGLNAH